MNFIGGVVTEILGMFVDDGALALAAAILIALVALAIKLAGAPPLLTNLVLLVGCVLILIESVARAARKKRSR